MLLHRTVHFSQSQQQAGIYEGRPRLPHLTGRSIRGHQLSLPLPCRVCSHCLPALPVPWLSPPRSVWWKPNQVEKEELWCGNKALLCSTSPPAFRAGGATLVSHSWRQSTLERGLDETCTLREAEVKSTSKSSFMSRLVSKFMCCTEGGGKKRSWMSGPLWDNMCLGRNPCAWYACMWHGGWGRVKMNKNH